MIIEKDLRNGLIERWSDRGVYIRNTTTGEEYALAVDWDDLNRARRGQKPVRYEETERKIEADADGG